MVTSKSIFRRGGCRFAVENATKYRIQSAVRLVGTRSRTFSADRFDQGEALAAPMADSGHHRLGEGALHRLLEARAAARRKQFTPVHRQRRKRDVHHHLWL